MEAAEYEYIFAPFAAEVIDRGDGDEEWTPEARGADQNQPPRSSNKHGSRIYEFGHPPGVKVGDVFGSRRDLFNAGVHAGLRAGIHGRQESGAFSIVMSGGYEDEEDFGERIIYIGTGGREVPENKGPQQWDQTMEHRMNKTMMKSIETRNPVRVVRGCGLRSPYAPDEGWRYDGLYTVQSASMKKGRSGFMVCAFELQRVPNQPPIARSQRSPIRPQGHEAEHREKRRRGQAHPGQTSANSGVESAGAHRVAGNSTSNTDGNTDPNTRTDGSPRLKIRRIYCPLGTQTSPTSRTHARSPYVDEIHDGPLMGSDALACAIEQSLRAGATPPRQHPRPAAPRSSQGMTRRAQKAGDGSMHVVLDTASVLSAAASVSGTTVSPARDPRRGRTAHATLLRPALRPSTARLLHAYHLESPPRFTPPRRPSSPSWRPTKLRMPRPAEDIPCNCSSEVTHCE